MRRTPLPRTDGGPERPTIGLAQHAIVTRAQALWSAFHPLYKELAFAFAVGDDRRFKRLIRPLNALAQDMADCQDILFKAWGIGDFDHIRYEINAHKDRTPEATARRAADIESTLARTEALAARAQDVGMDETADNLRYLASRYASIADPEMPPLSATTEDKDLAGRDWFIRQSFSAIRLAAETLRTAEEMVAAEMLRHRREIENLQNEPHGRSQAAAAAAASATGDAGSASRTKIEEGGAGRSLPTADATSPASAPARTASRAIEPGKPQSTEEGPSPPAQAAVPGPQPPPPPTTKPHPWDGIVPPERRGAGTMADPLFRPDPLQFVSQSLSVLPSTSSGPDTWRTRANQPPPQRQSFGLIQSDDLDDDEYEWVPKGDERIGMKRVRRIKPASPSGAGGSVSAKELFPQDENRVLRPGETYWEWWFRVHTSTA